ncbi:MAG: hypothetical protein GY943_16690 [Chloroflexi bacterium]|nr:hypothetical protein [Chloroflexota bacterium]
MLIFLAACFSLVAVGCQQEADSNSENDAVDIQFAVEGELPSSPPAQGWIADAAADLSEKIGVDIEDVSFITFELPVWPDNSYGCPQPGQEYQPEPKEGYQIQFRVNGRDYFYHGGEDIEQFLCENE